MGCMSACAVDAGGAPAPVAALLLGRHVGAVVVGPVHAELPRHRGVDPVHSLVVIVPSRGTAH